MVKMSWLGAIVILFALSSSAHAVTVVGGISFDDNAFVDELFGTSGTFTRVSSDGTVNTETLSDVLTDSSESTFALPQAPGDQPPYYVDLRFTDNRAFNGTGNDIAIFELGTPISMDVTINGVTQSVTSAPVVPNETVTIPNTVNLPIPPNPAFFNFALNVAYIDLDNFGIVALGLITDIRIGLNPVGTERPSLALVGAINSVVPLPAALPLLASALGGFGILGWRRGKAAKAAV